MKKPHWVSILLAAHLWKIWRWIAYHLPVGIVAWCLIRAWEAAGSKAEVDEYFDDPFFFDTHAVTGLRSIASVYENWELE